MIKFIKKNIYLSIFILTIILSIILRFYQLGTNPISLDWDEASTGYNAYSILKTGKDEYGNKMPLTFRSFDDYKPPVYIYLTVPSVAIFGLNEFAVRLPAAVIGVVAVAAVYFFTLEILQNWDKKNRQYIALCASFFLAISPWHLQFSRAAFEGNIGICFLIIALLFFFKGLKRGWYLYLFAIFFIISLYSYHSFLLINPILLISLVGLFYKDLWKQKIAIGLALGLILLGSVPIYSSFIHTEGTSARFSMVTVFSDAAIQKQSADQLIKAKENHDILGQVLYNRRIIFIPVIVSGYLAHFNFDFLFLHGDSGVQHHSYNMGMLYLFDFPFILIGLVYLFKKRDRRIFALLILFLLAPLPGAIATGAPHPVRAIAMIPAFQIFSAIGLVTSIIFLLKNKQIGKVLIAILLFSLIYNFTYYLHSYYIETPIKYGYFWQYGNKEAIIYAKQHEKEYDHIFMSYSYDQPYIYYLFYNKIDPSWYHKNWNYSGKGTVDRFYRRIGKYEFVNITDKQLIKRKSLIIGTPDEVSGKESILKKEIKFPDGRIAYKIISL
ncbi:MAG TPA: glycosyltransferase family 39 protein [Candidatus Saccharimonadales bacterium]|nr:glycosyltransferase family 39 protein [Candidatus Saccharimonadales bacterium]